MRQASQIFLFLFMATVVVVVSWHFKSLVFAFFALGTIWPLVISAVLIERWKSMGAWLWVMGASLLYVAWITLLVGATLFGVGDPLLGVALAFMGFYAAPVFCIFWGIGYIVERWQRKSELEKVTRTHE